MDIRSAGRKTLLVALIGSWVGFLLLDTAMALLRGWYLRKMKEGLKNSYRTVSSLRTKLGFLLAVLNTVMVVLFLSRKRRPN